MYFVVITFLNENTNPDVVGPFFTETEALKYLEDLTFSIKEFRTIRNINVSLVFKPRNYKRESALV